MPLHGRRCNDCTGYSLRTNDYVRNPGEYLRRQGTVDALGEATPTPRIAPSDGGKVLRLRMTGPAFLTRFYGCASMAIVNAITSIRMKRSGVPSHVLEDVLRRHM